jgi:hypothetical protein
MLRGTVINRLPKYKHRQKLRRVGRSSGSSTKNSSPGGKNGVGFAADPCGLIVTVLVALA